MVLRIKLQVNSTEKYINNKKKNQIIKMQNKSWAINMRHNLSDAVTGNGHGGGCWLNIKAKGDEKKERGK